jgi:oxygen-dependent protoporphyrinogen oxidase
MPRVAVIGGGAAGLGAAARLAMRGAEVSLFEAAETIGGQLRTVRRDGWLAEAGALLVAEPAPDVRAMLDAAGLGPRTVRAAAAARRRYVVHQGIPLPIPATLGDLVASSLLSIGGRLRMAREPFIPRRTDGEEESVDAFARRRFGDEVAERLFDSLVAEMSAGDSTRTLVRHLFPKLPEFEQSAGSVLKGQMRAGMEARRKNRGRPQGAWSCIGGLGSLADALATVAGVTVHPGVPVRGVASAPDGFMVETAAANARVDGVVLAVPAPALADLTREPTWRGPLELAAAIPSAPVAMVSLGFRRDAVAHPLDGLSIRIPSHEGRPLLSIFIPGAAFPDRAPEGHVLLSCLVGGVFHPDAVTLPTGELVALVRDQLADLVGARGEPGFTEVTPWLGRFPQAVTGHAARLAAVEELETAVPRLALTGAWRDGLAVSDALRGGVRAADRIATGLGLPA